MDRNPRMPWRPSCCYAALAALTGVMLVPVASAQTYSKVETTTYHDDTAAWVLGQVQSRSTDGIESERTEYNAQSLPLRTYAFGKLKQTLAYNADGTLRTAADGLGNTTTVSNWKRGVPQSITFADGAGLSALVNDDGTVATVVNELGAKTCYAYDAMGRIAQITYPSETTAGVCDGSRWSARGQNFRALTASDWRPPGVSVGQWRQQEYVGGYRKITYFDAMWRPVLVHEYDDVNVAGTLRSTAVSYNPLGQVVFTSYPSSELVPAGVGMHTTYDALGRVVRTVQDSELGSPPVSTTEYLPGLQIKVTNPRGLQTTSAYVAYDQPGYDQLAWSVMPEGAVVEIGRDPFGRPQWIKRRNTDGSLSSTRRYVYDGAVLCKTIEPETGATVTGHDAANNPIWSASGLNAPDPGLCDYGLVGSSGRMVSRTYDTRNRLVGLTFPDSNGNQTWTYTADGKPKDVTTLNDNGTTTTVNAYTYNNRGLLTGESSSQPGWYTWSLGYGYDAIGNLSTQTYPTGLVVSYAPNALGLPTAVTSNGGDRFATGISYYPNSAIRQFTYGNGIVHTMQQNARQLPQRVTSSGGVLDYQYFYDQNSNVTHAKDWRQGDVWTPQNKWMNYDGLDRLVSVGSGSFGGDHWHRFTYDALDNIKSWTLAGVKDYANYYYDPTTQRLISIQNSAGASIVGLDYDAQGNLSNKNGQIYAFDTGNRLRGVNGKESYRYDGAGRRVLAWSPNGGTILSMYSQSGQLMYDQSDRTALASEKIYLTGSVVAIRDYNWGSGQYAVKYQHTDALGSPVAVTNQAAQVIERTDWEPYGAAIGKPGYQGIGFTGHVMDGATGLTYMQQRYYDPQIGRFLSVDPVTALDNGDMRHFNRYAYAYNNPYSFLDPDGRCPAGASKSTCIDTAKFDASRSGGQNVQASATTEAAMKSGAKVVAVGSGSEEKLGFTAPSQGGGEKVTLAADASAGSDSKGFTASGTPPSGATGVIHGHLEESGLVDKAGIGDAGPVKTHGLPNAAVSSDGKRIGVTEVVNGKVQFRMIQGRMTPTEMRLKQSNVNTQQSFFYKDPVK